MITTIQDSISETLRRHALQLTTPDGDYQPLIRFVGDAHFVLLGEASHGTHEFYRARAAITKLLIEELNFDAVAVEADWPDAYRVNRFVRGLGSDNDPQEALKDFTRFPTWMWRNTDVLDFITDLRRHNDYFPHDRKVGFYGLDLYSLHSSMAAVIKYLNTADPQAARRARQRYSCFDSFGDQPKAYGYQTSLRLTPNCEDQVIAQLRELREQADAYLRRDGLAAEDELFCAQQNARVAASAEQYYRQMFHGDVSSWNLRDTHMHETLQSLWQHLRQQRGEARIVVWAHNSHLGDARATAMADRGELNLGQLTRQSHNSDATLIGFTTFDGSVSAADDWDGPVHNKRIRPARSDSHERTLHEVGFPSFILPLRDHPAVTDALSQPRLERAIGVIYRPESELASHYFRADLTNQFDAVIHFDHTHAVEPLELTPLWRRGDLPETYPTAL